MLKNSISRYSHRPFLNNLMWYASFFSFGPPTFLAVPLS